MGALLNFSTGAGAVKRGAKDAIAAQTGNAANLTKAADQWYTDPNREAQTQSFMGALRGQLGDATQRGFTDLARGTKFRTARQGLTGGSVDTRRQTRNLEDLFREQLGNEAKVQDAGNNLRTQDFGTRQSLINQAYGVSDIGQNAARRDATGYADGPDWASTIYGAGSGIAGAFKQRSQNQAFLDALKGSMRGGGIGGGMPAADWSLGPVGFGGG
jgi:hypothetical protein